MYHSGGARKERAFSGTSMRHGAVVFPICCLYEPARGVSSPHPVEGEPPSAGGRRKTNQFRGMNRVRAKRNDSGRRGKNSAAPGPMDKFRSYLSGHAGLILPVSRSAYYAVSGRGRRRIRRFRPQRVGIPITPMKSTSGARFRIWILNCCFRRCMCM